MSNYPQNPGPEPGSVIGNLLKYIKDERRRSEFLDVFRRLVVDGQYTRDFAIFALGLAEIVINAFEHFAATRPSPTRSSRSNLGFAAVVSWVLLASLCSLLLGYYAGYVRNTPSPRQAEWSREGAILDSQHIRIDGHVNLDGSTMIRLAGDRALADKADYVEDHVVTGQSMLWPAPSTNNDSSQK